MGRISGRRQDGEQGPSSRHQLIVLLGQSHHFGIGSELLALLAEERVLMLHLRQLRTGGRQLVVLLEQHRYGQTGGQDDCGCCSREDHRNPVSPGLRGGTFLRSPSGRT